MELSREQCNTSKDKEAYLKQRLVNYLRNKTVPKIFWAEVSKRVLLIFKGYIRDGIFPSDKYVDSLIKTTVIAERNINIGDKYQSPVWDNQKTTKSLDKKTLRDFEEHRFLTNEVEYQQDNSEIGEDDDIINKLSKSDVKKIRDFATRLNRDSICLYQKAVDRWLVQREKIVLNSYLFSTMTFDEIADFLYPKKGCSPENIRSIFNKARRKLKKDRYYGKFEYLLTKPAPAMLPPFILTPDAWNCLLERYSAEELSKAVTQVMRQQKLSAIWAYFIRILVALVVASLAFFLFMKSCEAPKVTPKLKKLATLTKNDDETGAETPPDLRVKYANYMVSLLSQEDTDIDKVLSYIDSQEASPSRLQFLLSNAQISGGAQPKGVHTFLIANPNNFEVEAQIRPIVRSLTNCGTDVVNGSIYQHGDRIAIKPEVYDRRLFYLKNSIKLSDKCKIDGIAVLEYEIKDRKYMEATSLDLEFGKTVNHFPAL